MEEKKLTDEEIVKALDFCTVYEDCEECEYDDIAGCRSFLMRNALELIHRLQSENESLKKQIEELSKPRKKILANRVYSDTTLKSWKKEDLIEQIRILEHNWSCAEESLNNSVKNSEKIFAEQKAEIERLTEEKWKVQDDLDNYHDMYNEEVKKNAELQKQVDELTEKLQCPMDITEAVKPFVNEAVKDTAKEILQEIWEEEFEIDVDIDEKSKADVMKVGEAVLTEIHNKIKEIAKRKGVEVE